jgi:hypothetical protein
MKNILRAALTLSLVFATGLPVRAADKVIMSPHKHEAVAVTVRPGWDVATKFAEKGMFLLQLVPAGTDLKHPTTLINVVTYADLQGQTNALKFAKQEQTNAPKLAAPGKMQFKFTDESNPNDVTYEITLTGNPKFPDQFEVHRIITGKDGIHAIIYHVEPSTQTADQIAEMHRLVKEVKLVAPPKDAK